MMAKIPMCMFYVSHKNNEIHISNLHVGASMLTHELHSDVTALHGLHTLEALPLVVPYRLEVEHCAPARRRPKIHVTPVKCGPRSVVTVARYHTRHG